MIDGQLRADFVRRPRGAAHRAITFIYILLSILSLPSAGYALQPAVRTATPSATPSTPAGQGPEGDERHQEQQPSRPSASRPGEQAPPESGPTLRLADLERMALEGNPTMAQADAAVRASEGRRVQAGLLPNPIIGYTGEEFAFRAFGDKSEHLAFIEQTIPLGGKLSKSRAVFAQERVQAEQSAAAQKQRILNGVRIFYYRALGAQQLVEVRTQLAELSREAVKITGELYNIGQSGSKPNVRNST
jgi:cobalt-zinc-cadmium efflux system outer membrane protein